jgi:hypothetical protein
VRVHAGLIVGKNGASSASAASASLRYVVILPPKIDKSGGCIGSLPGSSFNT